MTDTPHAARERLREIVERRRVHDGATYRADDARLLLQALASIEQARDPESLPWVVELWCTRPKNGLVLERLESIATSLDRWRPEKAMGAAVAEPGSFDRYKGAFDADTLQEAAGVAFAKAILSAFSFVATGHADGSISSPKFAHPPMAQALQRPEWIELLASLRDHDDLGETVRWPLRAVPEDRIPSRPPSRAVVLAKPRGDALSRYLAGEHEAAWQSLCDLGPLGPDAREEARAVATAMMKRVRANAEAIAGVLEEAGYPFAGEPLGDPDENRELLPRLAELVGGPPPVSLEVFWETVGRIDFRRREDEIVCELDVDMDTFLLDNALEVSALADAWYCVEEWEELRETPYLDFDFSADELHKEWTSGGAPYAIRMPSLHADGRVLREPHRLAFVPYLRANFAWHGFLGYERNPDAIPYRRLVERLKGRLEPF